MTPYCNLEAAGRAGARTPMTRFRPALLLGALLLPLSCQNSDEQAAEFREGMDEAFADSMDRFSEGLEALQDDFARARVEAREQWEESGEPRWDELRAGLQDRADELEEWLVEARSRFAEEAPAIQEAEEELADLREEIANTEEP